MPIVYSGRDDLYTRRINAMATSIYESWSEDELFEVVESVLSERAWRALLNNWVRNWKDFLGLQREDVEKFQNCGGKTAKEIIGVRCAVDHLLSNGLAITNDTLSACALDDETAAPEATAKNMSVNPDDPLYRQVLDIFRQSRLPMHQKDVLKELRRNGIDATIHQVDEAIVMSTTFESRFDLLKWGIGTSIHRQYVVPPLELLGEIEQWLSDKFADGYILVMVNVVFDEFKGKCKAADVPNPQALYSCLRVFGNGGFRFPRYAAITNSDNLADDIIPLEMEKYILDAGRTVTRAELRDHVAVKFIISDNAFGNWLTKTPNITRLAQGLYIHSSLLE